MIETTLHGLVVGLGKIRKDGSKEFHWLDKPIHNRIVQGGIDYLLTYNGSNSNYYNMSNNNGPNCVYNPWRRMLNGGESSTCPYNGALQYMAIGTGSTATKFIDTALVAQVGGYSETPAYSTVPYNGFMVETRDTKTLHLRITLQSVAVENVTTVREVGWFGKIYGQSVYPMFSRVVLPTPVELAAGEILIVCYQLNVTLGWDEYELSSSLLSGLLDSDGNQLRAYSKRLVNNFLTNNSLGNWLSSSAANNDRIPEYIIAGNGSGSYSNSTSTSLYSNSALDMTNSNQWYKYVMMPPFVRQTFAYSSDANSYGRPSWCLLYNISGNNVEPIPSATMVIPESKYNSTIGSYTIEDHVSGTNYRDITVTADPSWPNMASGYTDVYAIIYNGMVIKFGHYDNADPSNPVWVPKPWRKYFGQSYKFTFRYKLSTADTVE